MRLAAFCAYLAAWAVFAIAAVVSGIAQFRGQAASLLHFNATAAIGTVLQIASAMFITFSMGSGPLRPSQVQLAGALALAPFAAALYVWALVSTRGASAGTLVTGGAYALVRHPVYLAFLAMLAATGLLVSSGPVFAIAVIIFIAGCELRVAVEEKELAGRFHSAYELYRRHTRWRYFPGLR